MSGSRPLAKISDQLFKQIWFSVEIPLERAADMIGCSYQALCDRAKRKGLPNRWGLKLAKRPDDESFTRMWNARLAVCDIAKLCGYSDRAYVHIRRVRLGLPARTRGKHKGARSCWGVINLAEYAELELARRMQDLTDGK